jgi:hypothetical protein
MRSEWAIYNRPRDQVFGPLIIHGQLYSMSQRWSSTTGKPSISDKMMWRNFILSLIPILFVAKQIFITVMPIITDKILFRHKKHLLWQIE